MCCHMVCGQSKKHEKIPRYRPGFEMMSKDAEYTWRGAKLVITQNRFPLAYRDPQVSEPSDRESAGMCWLAAFVETGGEEKLLRS